MACFVSRQECLAAKSVPKACKNHAISQCVCACVRACMRAYMRACERAGGRAGGRARCNPSVCGLKDIVSLASTRLYAKD